MAGISEPPKAPLLLLEAAGALNLIAPFFPREWASTPVNAVHVKQLLGGMINTLHLVRRETATVDEPSYLLIRHFGLEGDFKEPVGGSIELSAAQQAIVFWEMGRRGWGPKVYGFFPGGRLEEYIDSHTLAAAESMDPAIRRDVARIYARFHSLELPLRKDNFKVVVAKLSRSAQSKHEAVLEALAEVDDPMARRYANIFREVDWAKDLAWVSDLFEKHNCKVTVTHGDANYLNLLVKNAESGYKVVLIDYETTSYSYRGFDIGGHFNERMYCYNQPDSQISGHAAPEETEQRLFCEAYVDEMRALGQVLSEYDTVEHLMLEASIGRMYQFLFTNLMCTVYDTVEVEPLFLSGMVHMLETYKKLKQDFLETDHD